MRITVFTSNQPRHCALIERLAGVAEHVFAIQECNTILPGRVADFFRRSAVMQRYFERVIEAETKVFGGPRFPRGEGRGSIHTLPIRMGDLNFLDLDTLATSLDSDLFVVFGASYIRGPLCDLLVNRRAINIHMGVSPQYRGSSCNFWALFDRHPEYVGATVHLLTRGLDSGPMLFHALPPARPCDGFELGMLAVLAAQDGLIETIRTGEIFSLDGISQDRSRELRYTRNADFTDEAAADYLSRLPTCDEIVSSLRRREPAAFVRPHIPEEASVETQA